MTVGEQMTRKSISPLHISLSVFALAVISEIMQGVSFLNYNQLLEEFHYVMLAKQFNVSHFVASISFLILHMLETYGNLLKIFWISIFIFLLLIIINMSTLF